MPLRPPAAKAADRAGGRSQAAAGTSVAQKYGCPSLRRPTATLTFVLSSCYISCQDGVQHFLGRRAQAVGSERHSDELAFSRATWPLTWPPSSPALGPGSRS
jgi:hypothetical protein